MCACAPEDVPDDVLCSKGCISMLSQPYKDNLLARVGLFVANFD